MTAVGQNSPYSGEVTRFVGRTLPIGIEATYFPRATSGTCCGEQDSTKPGQLEGQTDRRLPEILVLVVQLVEVAKEWIEPPELEHGLQPKG